MAMRDEQHLNLLRDHVKALPNRHKRKSRLQRAVQKLRGSLNGKDARIKLQDKELRKAGKGQKNVADDRLAKQFEKEKRNLEAKNALLEKELEKQRRVHLSQSIRYLKQYTKGDAPFQCGRDEDVKSDGDAVCDLSFDDTETYIQALRRELQQLEKHRKTMIKHQQASDEQTVGNDEEMGTNDEKEVVDVMAEDEQPSESADSGNHYSNDNDDRATSVEQTAAEMGDSAHTEFSDATTQSEEAADKVVAPTQSSSTARADRWAADQKQQNLNEQATQLNEYDVNPAQTCELLSVQNLVDEKPAAHQAQQTGDAESSKFEDIEPKCAEQSTKESKDDVDEDPAQQQADAGTYSIKHSDLGDKAAQEMMAATPEHNVPTIKQYEASAEASELSDFDETNAQSTENQSARPKTSDDDLGCQCVGTQYAPDTNRCLRCGEHWDLRDRGRCKQIELRVNEIYQGTLAKSITSISGIEDFEQLSESEQEDIMNLIRMLDEMRSISSACFRLFATEHEWADRLISAYDEQKHQNPNGQPTIEHKEDDVDLTQPRETSGDLNSEEDVPAIGQRESWADLGSDSEAAVLANNTCNKPDTHSIESQSAQSASVNPQKLTMEMDAIEIDVEEAEDEKVDAEAVSPRSVFKAKIRALATDDANKTDSADRRKSEETELVDPQMYANMNPADDKYMCWDFNSAGGCTKGARCYWSHKWLCSEAMHPSGERLIGINERRQYDDSWADHEKHQFHDNGLLHRQRNDEYLRRWWPNY